MRYINCEFGFKGRPPFVKDYSKITDDGPEVTDKHFPNQIITAPGLDYSAWNGAMLIGPKGSLWGVKINYYENEKLITGNDFYERVPKSGPYAPDGSYAQIIEDPIAISWGRKKEGQLVGQVTCSQETRIQLQCYAPYNWPSGFEIKNDYILGQSPFVATISGDVKITGGYALYKNRYRVLLDNKKDTERFVCIPFETHTNSACDGKSAIYEFLLKKGEFLTFVVAINTPTDEMPKRNECEFILTEARRKYDTDKLNGSGIFGQCAEVCVNEMKWMQTYYPFNMKPFFPAGRPWMYDGGFNIWGWDETINGLIASYFSDFSTIKNQFAMTIGDERMGPLSLWIAYSHYENIEGLEACYQGYKKIYSPKNSDLVKGGPRNGDVGKGMDDTPMRETWRGLGEMYSLDMSCMKAWSLEALSYIANILGYQEESQLYNDTYQALIHQINLVFWNDNENIYMNRYISGEWATVKSPTSFYPLLAGAPDQEKAQRMIYVLIDESKFWGEYVIPTISKDDEEYGSSSRIPHNGEILSPYCYWRGTIWPPSNYLVYMGLLRYRFDDVSANFAAKTVSMWWNAWMKTGWSCENYLPETGERSQMSHKHQSWAQLFPLMGIQELIDYEVWNDGLRFGTLLSGKNTLANITFKGNKYAIETDDDTTVLYRDSKCIFSGKGGKFVVHDFKLSEGRCSFSIYAKNSITIKLEGTEPFNISAGKHNIVKNIV